MIQRVSEDRLWSQIVATAWCDDKVMKRLLSDPRAILAEYGLEVPDGTDIKVAEGTEVKVMEDADAVRHFILPGSPPDGLTEEDLVGGPVDWCCGGCGGCGCRCR